MKGDILDRRRRGFADWKKQPDFSGKPGPEGSYGEFWSLAKSCGAFCGMTASTPGAFIAMQSPYTRTCRIFSAFRRMDMNLISAWDDGLGLRFNHTSAAKPG